MLTADELRTAVLSPNPAEALEGLARRELDAGRTGEQVGEEVADLMPELRTLAGYEDRWEDHLVDVVDRLTGWTRPEAQIRPAGPDAGANGATRGGSHTTAGHG